MGSARALPLLLILAMLASRDAFAVPANPEIQTFRQPNGETFKAVLRGDEYQGWLETLDGYTIVKNERTGIFVYALPGEGGSLAPSGDPVTPGTITMSSEMGARLKRSLGLRPAPNSELLKAQDDWIERLRKLRAVPAKARGGIGAKGAEARSAPAAPAPPAISGTWSPRPVSGEKKLLVILVAFEDVALRPNAPKHWNAAIFDAKGKTVAAFYRDNSFGRVSIVPVANKQPGSPAGVVTVALKQKHPDCENKCKYATEIAWVNLALEGAAQHVDFAALDADRDGTISVDEALVYFILAGYETAAAKRLTPSIWAHRLGGPGVSVAGKKIDNWAVSGEMYDESNRLGIGTIAHEMGHAMGGLPDLYDIGKYNAGLGAFSVMSYGSWGADKNERRGTTPVGMDAWSRLYLGWSSPQYPPNGAQVTLESGLAVPGSAILMMNPAISTSEYWLAENRQPIGWDAGLHATLDSWKGGVLIQHIDSNVGTHAGNSFNKYQPGKHQGNTVVEPATAQCRLLPRGSPAGCPTLLFYSGNADAFSGTSKPNSNFYRGMASKLGITGISAPAAKMSATIESTQ
jgi:M6 family metalloprotease-like protein